MDRKFTIYLIGLAIGSVLVVFLPKPFSVNKERAKTEIAAASGEFPVEVDDAYGRTVSVPYPAGRVVSLAPSITEMLFYLGEGDRIVANTDYCTYPARAAQIEKIGRIDTVDVEKILSLAPDVVVGTTLTSRDVYTKLERLGLRAVALEHGDWNAVLADMYALGRFMGTANDAKGSIERLKALRAESLAAVPWADDAPRRGAVILYDIDGLYSPGGGTWPHDLLTAAGLRNLSAERIGLQSGKGWGAWSLEALLAANPDILFFVAPNREADPEGFAAYRAGVEAALKAPVWSAIAAVKRGNVHYLSDGPFNIPGPRMVVAQREIVQAIAD